MNKGLKKLALGLGTATAICMSMLPAYALGSIKANGATSGEVIVNGEVVSGATSQFVDDFSYLTASGNEEDAKAVEAINKLNEGTSLADALAGEDISLPEGVNIDLADFSLMTSVQDLQALDADGNPIEGEVTLSWEVPNLTEEAQEVYVLHYSTKDSKGWEVIKPDSLDYETKMITTTFEDLSPVAVIYNSTEATGATSETPDTSTSTNTALYVGAGAIALIAIGTIVYKKHRA